MTDVFQWERCDAGGGSCVDILAATNPTYLLAAADVGHVIRARGSRNGVLVGESNGIGPVTAPAPAPGGWAAQIAYTATRPAFTPSRDVGVANQSQLAAAISNLQAGDYVHPTASFNVTGEITCSKRLAGVAVIDMDDGVHTVNWLGFSAVTPGLVCLYFTGNSNIRFYLGDMTNPGGAGAVDFFNSSNCLMWIRKIHDTGGDGISVVTNAGPVNNNNIYVAECVNWETIITNDPHAEKGTGGHACQFGDGGNGATGNKFTMWAHNGPHGTVIQYGASSGNIVSNEMRILAQNLTMVSTSQRAGNGVNLWGSSPISADFKYLEVDDAEGYAVSVDNEFHANFAPVVVEFGRATNTQLNPAWGPGTENTWNPGPTYLDVLPAP